MCLFFVWCRRRDKPCGNETFVRVWAVFVFGFPAWCAWFTWTHHEKASVCGRTRFHSIGSRAPQCILQIVEDQLLRAMKMGQTRTDNPNLYQFRKAFNKLYYLFKPTFHSWIIVIIARKLLLSTTSLQRARDCPWQAGATHPRCVRARAGLMFRSNPAFQLSMALLISFYCFVLQVRARTRGAAAARYPEPLPPRGGGGACASLNECEWTLCDFPPHAGSVPPVPVRG